MEDVMLAATVIRASVEMDFGDRVALLPQSLRFMIKHALPNLQELVVAEVFDAAKRPSVPLPSTLMERTDRYALFLISSGHRARKGDRLLPAHGQVFRDDNFGGTAVDLAVGCVLERLAVEQPWLRLLRKASGQNRQLSFSTVPATKSPLALQVSTCESNPQNVAIFSFFRNGR